MWSKTYVKQKPNFETHGVENECTITENFERSRNELDINMCAEITS